MPIPTKLAEIRKKAKPRKPRAPKQVTAAREATKVPASLFNRHEVVALSGFTYPWLWHQMRRGLFPRPSWAARACGLPAKFRTGSPSCRCAR